MIKPLHARYGLALAALALALGGCGRRALSLPTDPVDRAATCGVVTAIAARQAAGAAGKLPVAAQGRIFQFPLLAASQGPRFDSAIADATFKRMPQLFDRVSAQRWQAAVPACAGAYPSTRATKPAPLPTRPLDRALQCYMVADFMRKALGNQGGAYASAVQDYSGLAARIDAKLARLLPAAGIDGGEALQRRRQRAMAAAAHLGPPTLVIAACQAHYPA